MAKVRDIPRLKIETWGTLEFLGCGENAKTRTKAGPSAPLRNAAPGLLVLIGAVVFGEGDGEVANAFAQGHAHGDVGTVVDAAIQA